MTFDEDQTISGPSKIVVNISANVSASLRRSVIEECIDALKVERDRRREVGGIPGPEWISAISVLRDLQEDGLPKVVSRAIPPEPPRGSVVLDKQGYAYQRGEHTWQAATKYTAVSWESLNQFYAPLSVVYTPEEAS